MKRFLAQLRWLFSPRDKKSFLLLALLMAVSALLEMAGIGLLLAAAALFLSPQAPVSTRAEEILNRFMPEVSGNVMVVAVIGGIALLLVLKNLFALWIVDLQGRFVTGKQTEVAGRLFDTYIYSESEIFRHIAPDKAFADISRITQLSNLILLPGMQIIADFLVIMVLFGTMLGLFPLITVGSLLFMLSAAVIIGMIAKKLNRRVGEEYLWCENERNRIAMTGIAGEKCIKTAAAEKFFSGKFLSAYRKYASCQQKLYTLGQIPRFTLESAAVVTAAGIFSIMLAAGVPQPEIMLVLAVLTAAVARILPALSRCHYNFSLLLQNIPLLENIIASLQNIPREKNEISGEAADASQTIKFDNVTFAYRDGKEPVLSGYSLELPPLSYTALAGRSGRGKSTLAELLMGLLKPVSGRITAGGVNIANDFAAWRKQIGFVPQNIFIAGGSLRENVAWGVAPENINDRKVEAALRSAQLEGLALDMSLDSAALSGGQKQRLGIARALYQEVKLLILDEATSALDAATEDAFCQTLEAMRGKVTLLLISHRDSTLRHCDRIVEL